MEKDQFTLPDDERSISQNVPNVNIRKYLFLKETPNGIHPNRFSILLLLTERKCWLYPNLIGRRLNIIISVAIIIAL